MSKRQDVIDNENAFKEYINTQIYKFDIFIDELERITGFKLPNIYKVYRDITWYFVDYFEKKGINYFGNDCYLRVIVDIYLKKIFNYCDIYYSNFLKIAYYNNVNIVTDIYLKSNLKKINSTIDMMKSITIDDLPYIFELCLYNKFCLLSLLPDTCESFIQESLKELEILGFDLGKEVDLEAINSEGASLKRICEITLANGSIEGNMISFEEFVNSNNIILHSELAENFKKSQYRL